MDLYAKVKYKNIVKKIIERRYGIAFNQLFNTDRYYIIRRHEPWAGFFANYIFVLQHIMYALEKGYKPVVDMENYRTLYSENEKINSTANAWEYYFRQPFDNDLKEAYKSKNYIISDTSNYLAKMPYREGDGYFDIDYGEVAITNEHICSLVPIKNSIKYEIEELIRCKFDANKVLGVHVRGTDKRNAVVDHRVSGSIEDYIDAVDKMITKNQVDLILLCTDEKEAVIKFMDKYGDMIIINDAFRANADDTQGIHLSEGNGRENHKYRMGYEVLRDAYMLSKCEYLVFGHSNVTNAAILMNGGKYSDCSFVENNMYTN